MPSFDLGLIKGPKGDTGPQGPAGADGINGADGTGRKSATVVVGLGDAGYTESDVDIFIPAGTADCLSYLDQALASVPDGGGKILLMDGVYAMSDSLTVSDKANIIIEGCGWGTVLTGGINLWGQTTGIVRDLSTSGISVLARYITITGCNIDAPDSYAISLSSKGGVVITGNHITGLYGINGINTSDITIRDNIIVCGAVGVYLGPYTYNVAGIPRHQYSADYMIVGNTITGSSEDGEAWYGIRIAGVGAIVRDNYISRIWTTGAFAFSMHTDRSETQARYSQITGNVVIEYQIADNPPSVFTTDGSTAAVLPGSPVTIEAFGTGNVCGFNVV